MNKYLLSLLLSLTTLASFAQFDSAPAFPGAEGHGRYTTGGRGGKIIHVTNLNDSGTGSLRAAVNGSAKKIIVFDVAGVIALNSDLKIGENTTILGQTAPSPGITLRYRTVRPNGNTIIRFIRIRRGQEKDVNEGADALWQREINNLILDHCSFSWSIDEVASFYDNNNFTMQWCTIGEALTNAGHGKGAHGFGGIWGGKLASFHHNLLIHLDNRVPRFNGARYLWSGYTQNRLYSKYKWENTVQAEVVDFRNCVMYNWGSGNGCYGGPGGGYINIVNNYYKAGPATNAKTRVTQISKGESGNSTSSELLNMTSLYYIKGNYVTAAASPANYDWSGVKFDQTSYKSGSDYYTPDNNNYYGSSVPHVTINGKSCVKIKQDSPCAIGDVTTHTAQKAYDKVLDHAGASLYRDDVDARYATETRNNKPTYTGSVTKKQGIVDVVSDVKGYTEANFGTGSHPAGFDSDNDGMPDEWETANGLNPNDASDALTYTLDPKGYYQNIEVYANSLVEDIVKAERADSESSFDEYYPTIKSSSTPDTPDTPDTPSYEKLLWDYTSAAPASSPDKGLYFASKVNDGAGTNNGLMGIKMNSSGYAYFQKPAVAGKLKLTFGPRSGSNASTLGVYGFTGELGNAVCDNNLIATTPEVTERQTVSIDLTAAQTNIYIKRVAAVEQVLTKIEFLPEGMADEVQPCTITYKDHLGNIYTTKQAKEGDALGEIPNYEGIAFSKSEVFRGWIYSSGIKAKSTDILTGNTTITALVTPYEWATVGTVQNYSLTSNIFYPEDHELISFEGGYYHDNQHGWAIASNGKINVQVAGNAQVVLSLCQFSKDAAITVTDADGNTIQTISSGKVASDGATATINYKGDATTLTITFAQGESYIHSIAVYNVLEFVEKDAESGYYIIPANDGAAFLLALNSANSEEGAKIFLPNGTYDLGETVGTTVSGKNMSIIGQQNVTIVNAPNIKLEGLGKADLLCNTSDGLYMQQITLKNALDYYAAGSAGRAAAFHDKGNHTACYYVTLDSYQDTYYSHKDGGYFFWNHGGISGTVDYICGSGNVFFDSVALTNRSRDAKTKKGECTITAPYTSAADMGYVFQNSTITTESEKFNFGRSWGDGKCAFLNTKLVNNSIISTHWTPAGMNSAAVSFKEYNTTDMAGNVLSPASNVIEFTHKDGNKKYETILSAQEAEAYSYDSFFKNANWDPRSLVKQETAVIASLSASTLTMDSEGTYLLEDADNAGFFRIFTGKSINYAFDTSRKYTVRKANARGGFGAAASLVFDASAIQAPAASSASTPAYNLQGIPTSPSRSGLIIKSGKKFLNK